jgi:hypothetical protein
MWYIVTGKINVDNFTKLRTVERGFIWRGFTLDFEMKPEAANYNEYGALFTYDRTGDCQPLAEIKRVAEKIYDLNKLQKFPFEIPLSIRSLLFPRFYRPEEKLFQEKDKIEFPDRLLAQALSLVQHESGGTSLLDFSLNKYKALYFAIGNENNVSQNSRIFGLNVPYFETCKDGFPKETFGKCEEKFDLLYPSYFMNDKIARQEGMFLYQKFDIDESGCIKGEKKYANIIEFFKARYEEAKKNEAGCFEEISIDDFLEMTKKEGDKSIFYVLLDVPAKEKPALKEYLNTVGLTDNFMTAQVVKANAEVSVTKL